MTISAQATSASFSGRSQDGGFYRRAGLASLFVHGAGAGALLLGAFWLRETARDISPALPPPVGEFTVVPADGGAAAAASGVAENAPIRFHAPPSVRVWTPPAREAEPTPDAPTNPRVDTTRPANPRPRQQTPATSADAPRTSYGDFQRRHGAPDTTPSSSTPTGTATAPRIATDWSGGSGRENASSVASDAGNSATTASMDGYFGLMLQNLRERHEAPTGLSAALNTEVSFTLAADGSISGLRITRSSGDADFDRSVLDVFARVRLPARPDGKSDLRRLTFRVRDV